MNKLVYISKNIPKRPTVFPWYYYVFDGMSCKYHKYMNISGLLYLTKIIKKIVT